MRRLTIALMLLSSTALAQAPTFSSLTVNGPINGNGTINVSSGSSNAAINQGSTGLVWQMNLGAAASELRFVNSSGTKLLGVGTSGNYVDLTSALNINVPGVVSGSSALNTDTSAIIMNKNWSGTYTGSTYWAPVFLQVASDTVANTNGGSGSVLLLTHKFGGGSAQGDRNTLDISSNLVAPTAGGGNGTNSTGMRVTMNALQGDGGTSSQNRGAIWATNNVVNAYGPAAYMYGVTGQETDIGVQAGASTLDKIGIHIVELSGDAVQGSRDDIAFDLNNQKSIAAGAPGWKIGIGFGRQGGWWPMSSTGTMIAAIPHVGGETMAVANGIDWSGVTFSGSAVKTPGFTVDGSGSVSAASYKVGATAGVSCAAGTVSLSTMVVTNGIVTHC